MGTSRASGGILRLKDRDGVTGAFVALEIDPPQNTTNTSFDPVDMIWIPMNLCWESQLRSPHRARRVDCEFTGGF